MTDSEFAALTARLERLAAERPRAYQLRLALLGALGYVYVLLVLLAIAAGIGGLVYLFLSVRHSGALLGKLLLPLVGLLWIVGKALWVRLAPPTGRELRREEAPALFAMVDEVRQALAAPRPHRVLLTDDFNAAVAQIPRFGLFGWPRSYLLLGVPLLAALTPEQCRAVLAHEFAHLSRAHARFGNWIHRVRVTWFQLMRALEQQRRAGAALFTRFFEWYAPFFGAYSFVHARQQEFEADRLAAAHAGAPALGGALVALQLRGQYLDRVLWPSVTARVAEETAPPRHAFVEVMRRAPEALPADAEQWLERALREQTEAGDTHPALAHRLAALGVATAEPAALLAEQRLPLAESALGRLLGPSADGVLGEFDAQWTRDAGAWWAEQHRRLRAAREELAELERKPLDEADADGWFRRADLTEDAHGRDAALPLVEALVAAHPTHAPAQHMLGRLLLAQGDERGLARLERAAELAEEAVIPAAQLAIPFLRDRGRDADAERWRQRAIALSAQLAAADAERGSASHLDRFHPVALSDADRATLQRRLARHDEVRRVWLVRKETRLYPERPLYVFGVDARSRWSWVGRSVPSGLAEVLVETIADAPGLDPSGSTLVLVFGGDSGKLRRAMRTAAGAALYER